MSDVPTPLILAFLGFGCGLMLGGVARATRFCTFGAIEDYVLAERTERLRAWGLAIAVAMLCVSALYASGIARIDQTFYLNASISWGGTIVGGLLFGFGMSMVGTCGYGVLIRMGGGDLKALVAFFILGVSAYAAARGITAPIRMAMVSATTVDFSAFGGQGIPHIVGAILNIDAGALWLPIGATLSFALMVWCFRSSAFRSSRRDIVTGLLIGLVIAVGFAATGILGKDPFNPQPVGSMTYVLPPGETIVYLLTYTGASLDFGIGAVLGTIVGAFVVAAWKRELRWEAFDGRREMRRHIGGAFLMGFGGLAALGCTVGQGMTGMSTLSIGAPLVLVSIFVGASFGIYYLVSDDIGDAIRNFLAFKSYD